MNRSSFLATPIIERPSHTRELYQTMAISGSYDAFVSTLLGELRALFGTHIAYIAVHFGIDLEENLASIVPPNFLRDDEPEQEKLPPPKKLPKKK